ncbi:MAG: hypothetical protein HRU12_08770 [Phaeodactylibacter sp.]|nr:hypothetical protein [Phaeodactylibacter sp.]
MNINDLTFGQIKEITSMIGGGEKKSPVEIGKAYLFRTVTHIEVGRVKSICGDFVTLEDASWIADTGRYHDCLVKGVFNEVEPYPETTTVNMGSMINFAPWNHELPSDQK